MNPPNWPYHPTYRKPPQPSPTQPLPPKQAKQYARAMTIVAGFTCKEGIVLFADTEYSSTSKLQASKLFPTTYDDGSRSVITLTGDMMYGRMCLEEIEQAIRDLPTRTHRRLRDVVAGVLHAFHQQQIYPHPDRQTRSLAVGYLIALYSAEDKNAKLLTTNDTAVVNIRGYDCLGVGSDLAHYLIRAKYQELGRGRATQSSVESLAAYVFGEVKRQITYCGGDTEYVAVTHDGGLAEVHRLDKTLNGQA